MALFLSFREASSFDDCSVAFLKLCESLPVPRKVSHAQVSCVSELKWHGQIFSVPHVLPVAVAVTFCALSVGAWQRSSAPSGAGIVLDTLMISVLIVLQNRALCETF
jgi:hypothetical protein